MPPNFPNDINSQYIPQLTLLLQQSVYFNKFCAIDTYPDQPQLQCLLLVCQNLGSIYSTLQHQFQSIVGYQINFQTPTIEFIKFIRQSTKTLKQFYNYTPFNMIFKQHNQSTQNFYQKYIIPQNQNLTKQTITSSQFYIRKYLQNILPHLTPKMLIEYPNIVQRKLKAIHLQNGDSRLQPLLTMIRQLHGMFGFQLKAQKSKNKNINKVIIRCSDQNWTDKKKPKISNQNTYPIPKKQKNKPLYTLKYSLDQIKINSTQNQQILIFMTDIISQLLQYQFLTGKSYPRLHPLNIQCYFNQKILSKFTLSPYPILTQTLASSHKTYIDSKIAKIFFKQQNIFLDFSQQGNILKNNQSLILLIHYIETSSKLKIFIPNPQSKISWLETLQPHHSSRTYQILTMKTQNDQFPNLIDIANLFKLNCIISDFCVLRSQYLLWLRYKIMSLLWQTLTQKQKNQNQDNTTIIQIGISAILTAMDYQEFLRQNQQKLKNEIQQFISNILNHPSFQIPLKFTTKTPKNISTFLTSLTHQITYLHKKTSQKNKFLKINFSKNIYTILNTLYTNIKYSLQQSSKFQILIKISINIILFLNQNNIIWYHNTIYRKLKRLVISYDQITKEQIFQIYDLLKGNQYVVQKRIWWGNIWNNNQTVYDF